MLRFKYQLTKLLISIREVTHHLSLTLYMYGKFTNDRFRKMEALLKFGRLLGSGFNVFKSSKRNRNIIFRNIQAGKPKYTVN